MQTFPYRSLAAKSMPDGRIAEVNLLLFGRARIDLGDGRYSVDDCW